MLDTYNPDSWHKKGPSGQTWARTNGVIGEYRGSLDSRATARFSSQVPLDVHSTPTGGTLGERVHMDSVPAVSEVLLVLVERHTRRSLDTDVPA